MGKTWKPTVAGILMIIGGCMGIGGGLSIIFLGTLIADLPGMYDYLLDVIRNATALGLSFGILRWLGLVPVTFGIIAIIGAIYAFKRKRWGFTLISAILTMPIGIPLGILSTIFVAASKKEFE